MSHSAGIRRGPGSVSRAVRARGTKTAAATAVAVAMAAAAVFASAGSSAAAAARDTSHDTAHASTASAQSARSTRVHVVNGTTTTLYRNYSSLSHGVWDDETPPESIDGGSQVVWGSHSSGVMTGTEGDARYSIGNAGEVSIHWNNPYVGSNSYSCTAPAGYSCARSGGSGDNADVWFTISGGGRTAAAVNSDRRSASAAARSTHVTLQNRTPNELLRTSSSLVHGTWSENLIPPDHVYPMSNATWQSESNGFMTGTEGSAVYNMLNVGTVRVSWNNPYVGSNGYSCAPPSGYVCRQDGGGGDNAAVTFTVLKG
ncbi:aegerolysin family protein [Streptomyces sp. NPDC058751]|uniref:aegerolysin family protein n=1 Tax=Streptomyces sp. NPDC058751 TaxID=3346623 RepID=UPI0036959F0E